MNAQENLNLCFVRQLAVAVLLLLTTMRMSAQSKNPSFSADEVKTIGGKTSAAKVYSSDKAIRLEKQEKGQQSITIMHLDRKSVWVLNPAQKTYMDMGGIGTGGADIAASMEGAKVEREAMGSEDVGAYHCDKYRVKTTYEGKVYTSIEWDARELNGFPVKQADEKGKWSKEYQNVKLADQDPALFEVPSGYQKIDLGGMFKIR